MCMNAHFATICSMSLSSQDNQIIMIRKYLVFSLWLLMNVSVNSNPLVPNLDIEDNRTVNACQNVSDLNPTVKTVHFAIQELQEQCPFSENNAGMFDSIECVDVVKLLNWLTMDTLDEGFTFQHFSSMNCSEISCTLDYATVCWDPYSLPLSQKCSFFPNTVFLDKEASSGLNDSFLDSLFQCVYHNLSNYDKVEPRCGRNRGSNLTFMLGGKLGGMWDNEFYVGGFSGLLFDEFVMMDTEQVKELLINSFSSGKEGHVSMEIENIPRLNKKHSWSYIVERLLVFEPQSNGWSYLIVDVNGSGIQFFIKSPEYQIWQFNQAQNQNCRFIIAEGDHDKTRAWLDGWVKLKENGLMEKHLFNCVVPLSADW